MDIVLCTDNNYAMPCGVTINSILANNKKSSLVFHIVSMDLAESVKDKLRSISSIYDNATFKFYELKKDFIESYNFSVFDSQYMSVATYMRLFLGDILPEDVTKVIYLDCDVIVRKDLSDLWQIDIENYSIAGVEDLYASSQKFSIFKFLGYDESYKYFNAGIVFINIEYWRKHDLITVFLDYFKKIEGKLFFYDQDILNGTLYNTKLLLPIKYNVHEYYYRRRTKRLGNREEIVEAIEDPAIIHYSGADKPWMKTCMHPMKEEYLKYKSLSLWKDAPLIWKKNTFQEKYKYYEKKILMSLGLRRPRYYKIKKDVATGKYTFR